VRSHRVKKKKRATNLSSASLCIYFERKKVLFLFSYIEVHSIAYLKYPLRFVIHLVGEENSALLILGISERTCGVLINFY